MSWTHVRLIVHAFVWKWGWKQGDIPFKKGYFPANHTWGDVYRGVGSWVLKNKNYELTAHTINRTRVRVEIRLETWGHTFWKRVFPWRAIRFFNFWPPPWIFNTVGSRLSLLISPSIKERLTFELSWTFPVDVGEECRVSNWHMAYIRTIKPEFVIVWSSGADVQLLSVGVVQHG